MREVAGHGVARRKWKVKKKKETHSGGGGKRILETWNGIAELDRAAGDPASTSQNFRR